MSGPLSPPFEIHRSFRQKTRRVCVGRSHRVAAAVIVHTKRRKRRGAGDAERLALRFACLGDQVCANHDLLKAALVCSLGRSDLRFESLMPLYSTTISGQASSVFDFFFLVNFVPLLLTGKDTADPSAPPYPAPPVGGTAQSKKVFLFKKRTGSTFHTTKKALQTCASIC